MHRVPNNGACVWLQHVIGVINKLHDKGEAPFFLSAETSELAQQRASFQGCDGFGKDLGSAGSRAGSLALLRCCCKYRSSLIQT